MIRDDYKKQSIRDEYKSKVKESKLSLRELEEIQKVGERTYYSSKLPKLRQGLKVYAASGVFVLLTSITLVALVVLTLIFHENELDAFFWVCFGLMIALVLYGILCFVLFIPITKHKIKIYTQKIQEINEKTAQKQNVLYDYILKQQVKQQGDNK